MMVYLMFHVEHMQVIFKPYWQWQNGKLGGAWNRALTREANL